jgi:hypothetical protein
MTVELRDDESIIKTLSISPGSIWTTTSHVIVEEKVFSYDPRLSMNTQSVVFSRYSESGVIRVSTLDELNAIL